MDSDTLALMRIRLFRLRAKAPIVLIPFILYSALSQHSLHSAPLTNCDEPSLREAVNQGGLITITCDATITFSNPITISNAVTIDATGHAVTFSGANTVRLFSVTEGASLELVGLTLANGSSTQGGAISNDKGRVIAANCTFQNNRATGTTNTPAEGGAIYSNADLQITNCTFNSNTAAVTNTPTNGLPGIAARGGAIHSLGPLTVTQTLFTANSAASGNGANGALESDYAQSGGGAGGEAAAGAIYCAGQTTIDICTFSNNLVRSGAGGTNSVSNSGTSGNSGAGGSAFGAAALIDAQNKTALFSRCTFINNRAVAGNGAPGITFVFGPVRPGEGGKAAGAVYLKSGTLAVIGNSWIENIASAGHGASGSIGSAGGFSAGGGLYLEGGAVYATNNTFAANQTIGGNGGAGGSMGGEGGSAAGGAIFNQFASATISHATIIGNQCVQGLGGPLQRGSDTVYESARGKAEGAGIRNQSGQLRLANSILATNYLAVGSYISENWSGVVIDLDFNISSDFTAPFIMAGVDPKLLPLQSNGGPTKTFALQSDSPAIDFSNPAHSLPTDQRGISRACGRVPDAGAFEFEQPFVPSLNSNDLRTRIAGGGVINLETPGTFALAQTLDIVKDTTLNANSITFDGRSGVRVFHVYPGVNFTLIGATIANGRAIDGGGLFNNQGNVTIQNCTFRKNTAVGTPGINGANTWLRSEPGGSGGAGTAARGGAILNTGALAVSNSLFHLNTSSGGHGGIGGLGGEARGVYTLGFRCVPFNTSGRGGAGGAGGPGLGGAIWNNSAAALLNVSFIENQVLGGVGGTGGPAGVASCGQSGHGGNGGAAGEALGGAIYSSGTIQFSNGASVDNRAFGGAGGAAGEGHSLFSSEYPTAANGGKAFGGAVANAGSCFLTNLTFASNMAFGGFGGLGGAQTCGYSGSGGDSSGGAIDDSASTQFVHCTFSGNSALPGETPPGVCPRPGTNGIANASTINVRSAPGPKFVASILSNTSQNPLIAGPFTDGGYNLASDGTINFTAATSRTNVNPLLQPLDTSAKIPFFLPHLNSPARDAVPVTVATDQRGVLRPVGPAADIGAIEIAMTEIPPLITLLPTEALTLNYQSHPTSEYVLFESLDLQTWTAIQTNRAPANGSLKFELADLTRATKRFFYSRELHP